MPGIGRGVRDLGTGDRPHQHPRLVRTETVEVEPERVAAGESLADLGQRTRRLGVGAPGGDGDEAGVRRGRGEHVPQRAQGRVVGPVEVVEDHQDRRPLGHREQGPRDPVGGLEGLARRTRVGSLVDEAGQAREVGVVVGPQCVEHAEPRPQRRGAVVLRARPARDDVPLPRCLLGELVGQPGLADAGLAHQQGGPGGCVQESGEASPLLDPAAHGLRGGRTLLAGRGAKAVKARASRPRYRLQHSTQPRLLPQDRPLQVAQLRSGVEAQLLAQQVADLPQGVEGLGLPADSGQRQCVQRPPALLELVGGDPGLGGGQHARRLAQCQQPQQSALLGRRTHLLERRALRHHVRMLEEVGVRRPGPGRQHRVELVERREHRATVWPVVPVSGGQLGRQWGEHPLDATYVADEAVRVYVVGLDPQQVAVVGGLQHRLHRARGAIGVERLAHPGDVGVQGAVRRARWLARPHQVGQHVRAHRTAGVQRERRQHGPRLARADLLPRRPVPRRLAPAHPGGAEHRHLHGPQSMSGRWLRCEERQRRASKPPRLSEVGRRGRGEPRGAGSRPGLPRRGEVGRGSRRGGPIGSRPGFRSRVCSSALGCPEGQRSRTRRRRTPRGEAGGRDRVGIDWLPRHPRALHLQKHSQRRQSIPCSELLTAESLPGLVLTLSVQQVFTDAGLLEPEQGLSQ